MGEYILQMKNITKEFPGVKALDNVTFGVRKGEIHALCGENGGNSGKSTLMNWPSVVSIQIILVSLFWKVKLYSLKESEKVKQQALLLSIRN